MYLVCAGQPSQSSESLVRVTRPSHSSVSAGIRFRAAPSTGRALTLAEVPLSVPEIVGESGWTNKSIVRPKNNALINVIKLGGQITQVSARVRSHAVRVPGCARTLLRPSESRLRVTLPSHASESRFRVMLPSHQDPSRQDPSRPSEPHIGPPYVRSPFRVARDPIRVARPSRKSNPVQLCESPLSQAAPFESLEVRAGPRSRAPQARRCGSRSSARARERERWR